MTDIELSERVSAAVFEAAVEAASIPDKTGTPALDLQLAQEGAAFALAMLIDADPQVASGDELLAACTFKAAQVTSRALQLRKQFGASGERSWIPQGINQPRSH